MSRDVQEVAQYPRHSFDVGIAQATTVNAAIVFDHILQWCAINEVADKHLIDGHYWCHLSVADLKKTYPYLGEKAIRNAIEKLCDNSFVLRGEHNKKLYDKTSWYSLGNAGLCHLPKRLMDLSQRANTVSRKGEPIQSNSNSDISNDISSLGAPKSKPKRGKRIPDDWQIPDIQGFYAENSLSGEELNSEAEKFRDYWQAKPGRTAIKLDWTATWRNWLRTYVERRPQNYQPSNSKNSHEKINANRNHNNQRGPGNGSKQSAYFTNTMQAAIRSAEQNAP